VKILILGASGHVGRLVVEEARAHGHKVTAFVREPRNIVGDGVTVACGNVLDSQALVDALSDQDAAVYAIGVKSIGPTTLFSTSTRLLLAAMDQQRVKRLISITGIGAGETKGHGDFIYDHIIFPLFTKNRYQTKNARSS
jgi:putative NADH-flavin reductase